MRICLMLCLLGAVMVAPFDSAAAATSPRVTVIRTPNEGIQPQAVVDAKGVAHLIYFKGEPGSGDLYYVRRAPGDESWSTPVRVNSQAGSAIAAGTIRGGQIAVGRSGRVHVAWNGSGKAQPKGPKNPAQPADSPYNGIPMLYSRLNDAGTGFEPQRNLMRHTFALDGGGSIGADGTGNVFVAWHAADSSSEGEGGRRLFVARSKDDGKSFAPETAVYSEPTGACACCGTRTFADSKGTVYVLYRSAKEKVNRDMYLLVSRDQGTSYRGALIDRWKVPG